MGKTLIQQARGHGSMVYRVRKKAFSIFPHYPGNLEGEFEIVKLISSAGHTAPIAKMKSRDGKTVFHNLAANNIYEGQKVQINGKQNGDISSLGNLDNGTLVFNIEIVPKDGGKLIRTGGNSGVIIGKTISGTIKVLLPSKKEKEFNPECRATIGTIAGAGRLDKPILKAGKQYYIKRAKSKLWPRTSAVKMNAIDHPFGSGRGKRIKSKIAKNNAPAGAKVGHLHPRRTGRRKK
jgi:large subunit ribosomal protein L2